jgi:predicted GH43/DUF377 family glycosyl hydrolase/DNA-binding beta-propeller fold protein YncE
MRLLPLFIVTAGCVRDAPLPFVGKCAVYPSGVYEYGKIGIGTCLAGPNDLRFAGDPEDPTLLVTNANPYRIFDGGNVVAIPWNNIDMFDSRNLIHTLDPVAVDLPDFAGGLDVMDDLGILGVRLSENARTRVWDDSVWLLDLSDPSAPRLSDRGTDGSAHVRVMSDPVDTVIDPETGLAFVANRTSHTISVLDTTGDTVKVIRPWPEYMVTAAVFDDADEDGSSASLIRFIVLDEQYMPDDTWTLSWVDGTWRVWMPAIDGLWRATTYGDGTYRESALGIELALENAPNSVDEIADPFYLTLVPGRMMFTDVGSIRGASNDDYVGKWSFDRSVLLDGRNGRWDAAVGAPSALIYDDQLWMFYDGQRDLVGANGESAIGLTNSIDGLNFNRVQSDPVLSASQEHEGDHIADPHVVFDVEANHWRMYYSAFDGKQWSIGHATSDDLVVWTPDASPIFDPGDGIEAAAPAVSIAIGKWQMWYARWDGTEWTVGVAESPDGTQWVDAGTALAFVDGEVLHDHAFPPGPAIQGNETASFQIRGEMTGLHQIPLEPAVPFASEMYGWAADVVAGYWLNAGDAGPESVGGVRIDSTERFTNGGRAWLTITSRSGRDRIGLADMDADGALTAQSGAIFTGGDDSFDRGGVSYPVVFEDDGSYRMLYAGQKNGRTTIGLATSEDGEDWTAAGQVLSRGGDWDSVSIVPTSVQPLDGGGWRLWYSGYDGARWRVGSARSSNGEDWSKEPALRGYIFGPGTPGTWDDSGVRDAFVITDNDGDHMWYAGNDGDFWQGGYAFRERGSDDWARHMIPEIEETAPVLNLIGGLFHPGGILRPVVELTNGGYAVWFAGYYNNTSRVGRAYGARPDALNKAPRRPTVGDTLVFDTQRGDASQKAIPLDTIVRDNGARGVGLTSLTLDPERGMLYAVSKLLSYVFVIDIRDDTDLDGSEHDGVPFRDLNYLDVEALLVAETSSNLTGFRQIVSVPDRDEIYAIVDAPETIATLDISMVIDDEYPDVINDVFRGWLVAPRGGERDEGETSQSSVGPGQMVAHSDGRHVFLSNFNRNSVTRYDLTLGPYGTLVGETPLVGENPYAMTLSPDERFLVVANYTGEINGVEVSSTIAVLDADPASPTYMEVRTWIANQ